MCVCYRRPGGSIVPPNQITGTAKIITAQRRGPLMGLFILQSMHQILEQAAKPNPAR